MRLMSVDNDSDLDRELARVGADECCWPIFRDKHRSLAIRVADLSAAGANILKQTALACGADCAVHRDAVSGRKKRSDAILFLDRRRLGFFCGRLRTQPPCVSRLVPGLEELGRNLAPDLAITVGGRRLDLGSRTHVMGILNVTPDSFYDGGRHFDPGPAVARAEEMAGEGADFIDIGAESTRPGSDRVPPNKQLARLLPVLRGIGRRVKVPVSVDTTSARVARAALDAGAALVNDVSGLAGDPKMARLLAKTGVPCVVMHLPAPPKTMQRRVRYRDLMQEVVDRLAGAIARAEAAGVERGQLVVDPGIGFGKRLEHNLELLRRLGELRTLGRPVLVGPSRKAFIGQVLGLEPPDRLEGTLAACVVAARNGANILRVHDVEAAVRALRVADAIERRA
ncbi:dihydropteroate synthase [candidate division WOR-3 bacterium]|nr:dihydropteroate synthase [candidate division WOR-3 bacterium]